ncbi:MAG: hypothetical protein VX181_19915, partial [Pseudomonadota bacterium]|nr:hypothetical protein [Pseudomonadota bacterium]
RVLGYGDAGELVPRPSAPQPPDGFVWGLPSKLRTRAAPTAAPTASRRSACSAAPPAAPLVGRRREPKLVANVLAKGGGRLAGRGGAPTVTPTGAWPRLLVVDAVSAGTARRTRAGGRAHRLLRRRARRGAGVVAGHGDLPERERERARLLLVAALARILQHELKILSSVGVVRKASLPPSQLLLLELNHEC